MSIPGEANSAPRLEEHPAQGWWFRRWAGRRVMAGIADRHTDLTQWLRDFERSGCTVGAEQVHGSSVAIVEQCASAATVVAGADALLTRVPGVALLVRTADCLPVFFADPARGVVAMAHVGWRGLAGSLPARVVAAFRHGYQTEARRLAVAIGPAIRACCYEVGPEFAARFGPFVQERLARRTCDLIGATLAQLRQCGVAAAQVWDTRQCTACGPARWYSLRREGPATGRLVSFILWQP